MKFAKKLQDEAVPDWCTQYLDYKMMKKVLKREDEEAMEAFCTMLETQLHKVHAFMRGQQEAISEDIGPLDVHLGAGVRATTVQLVPHGGALNGHCIRLVHNIERFRDFATLNHTAIRKIIKKFDKRFHMQFHESIGLPPTTNLLVSDRDIGTWLLDPAQHCLALMRGAVSVRQGPIERPLRQFNFWVAELKAGAALARLRVSGGELPDPTAVRLRLLAHSGITAEPTPEEVRLCVRNTFIDASERRRKEPRRATSQPPRLSLLREDSLSDSTDAGESPPTSPTMQNLGWEEVDSLDAERMFATDFVPTPVVTLEHLICSSLNIPPPPRLMETEADEEDGHPYGLPRSGWQEDAERWAASSREPHSFGDFGAGSFGAGGGGPGVPPHRGCRHGARPPTCGQGGVPADGGGGAKSSSAPIAVMQGARWWTQLRDTCPISGFPVALLPYPPFKLQLQTETASKPSLRLIDGPFLVLQVLCTWRFEALGAPLTTGDVAALDAYMRRCKLGPFRLGRALELLSAGTCDSQKELEALRARAGRRLEVLRHVQRVRLERGDTEPPGLQPHQPASLQHPFLLPPPQQQRTRQQPHQRRAAGGGTANGSRGGGGCHNGSSGNGAARAPPGGRRL